MDAPRCRRFDLGDLMIAVATVAVLLALKPTNWWAILQQVWGAAPPSPTPGPSGGGPRPWVVFQIARTTQFLTWIWCGLTLGYLGFRLRGPRPPWAEVRRQPGFVAAAAAGALALFYLGLIAGSFARPGNRFSLGDRLFELKTVSPAVIGAWLGLWLSGRWEPEPGWVDRLGRLVGWAWIASYLITEIGWAITTS